MTPSASAFDSRIRDLMPDLERVSIGLSVLMIAAGILAIFVPLIAGIAVPPWWAGC